MQAIRQFSVSAQQVNWKHVNFNDNTDLRMSILISRNKMTRDEGI